jgi:hypothetical protein
MNDSSETAYTTLPKDDPHYASVGRVASNWAILESILDGTIANLALCNEEEMTCVTAQLIGPARRMDAMIALFTFRKGSDTSRKELKAFQGRIQQLGEDRNRVVHDPLCIKTETGEVHKMRATAKGELKYSFEPVSKEKMDKVADDINDAIQDFLVLSKKIKTEANQRLHEQLQEQLRHIPSTLDDQNPPDENA